MSLLMLLGVIEGPVIERISVTHEYQSDRLAWRIDPPTGAPSRWAADEPLAEKVVDEIQLVGEMPGGYKEASGTLARNPRTPWPDLTAYSDVSIYQAGAEEVWAGRLDKAPESDGDRMSIAPAAIGHQAALEDDKGIVGPGFIDCDLSKWEEPSAQRKFDVIGAGYFFQANTSVAPRNAGEALTGLLFDFTSIAAGKKKVGGELRCYGGGVDLGRLIFDFVGDGTASWDEYPALSSDDRWTSKDMPINLDGAMSASQQAVVATAPGRKYAIVQSWYQGTWTGQMTNRHLYHNVKVLGTHGLTLQGTWPNVGFTANQMLGYAIPKYTYLSVAVDELEDDGYVIPQAWFAEPGDMANVVKEVTKFGLLDWFVFGGKRFQLRKAGTYGRRWQAYAGPSELNEVGLDASRLWRSIIVRYQDVDGSTKTIGPPGSGADVTKVELEVTDPDHPAVRAGIVRKDILDLGSISTPEAAQSAGERWLDEANLLSRSGSCNLTGYVMDDRGTVRPAAQVKPGDFVRFPDAADRSYRKITRVDYTHAQRQASCALDGPPEGLAALLERYQATLVPLGL